MAAECRTQPAATDETEQRGLIRRTEDAFEGLTLIAPLRDRTTYLIDLQGEVVHRWRAELRPGNSAYLLDNGHLLRCAREPDNPVFQGGGQGGRIQEFSWDGELVWDYVLSSEENLHHHDIEPLPNGNVLLITWERKNMEEALSVGRDEDLLTASELWPDVVLEIEPVRPDGGKVVWEWHTWDHLVQDRDPDLANHGDVAGHPHRIDINGDVPDRRSQEELDEEEAKLRALGYLGGGGDRDDPPRQSRRSADWQHTNAIDYHAGLDQIVISVRTFNEFWVIDHSTSTAEARGSKGGRSGMGGDLLYRFGNPASYALGGPRDRRLFKQHDAQWIPEGCPGAGNFLVFNNGDSQVDREYSTVDEIVPPLNARGRYSRKSGQAFGPVDPILSIDSIDGERFHSGHISGAQRLPNGNTLICSGEQGRLVEVTPEKEVAWEFINPHFDPEMLEKDDGPGRGPRGRRGDRDRRGDRGGRGGPGGGGRPESNPGALFRATRLAPDHPGLKALR